MLDVTSPEWSDFLKTVKEARLSLGAKEPVWYRGQSSETFRLVPSLLRYPIGIEREKDLFNRFQRFSLKVMVRRPSDWETLFDMQHYGLPTRLLDWSELLGVAIFFATYDYDSFNDDAAIFVLAPNKLNSHSGIKEMYRLPEESLRFPYKSIYWDGIPFSPRGPIAVEPIFINERMLAQRGVFTVHDNHCFDPESMFADSIRRIRLPRELFDAAREFCEMTNINEFTVYPDLGGMASFLKRELGLYFSNQM